MKDDDFIDRRLHRWHSIYLGGFNKCDVLEISLKILTRFAGNEVWYYEKLKFNFDYDNSTFI